MRQIVFCSSTGFSRPFTPGISVIHCGYPTSKDGTMMEMILDGQPARCSVAPVLAHCCDNGLPGNPEAAHLQAADELLRRHGMSLADYKVSRVDAGFDGADDSVLFVVRVGRDIDVFTLNEVLTAVQLARGLSPSAQLDVVFQS
jgi:hypothetical protein